ncbi:MAG: WG repeat-containing protein [Nannocystaceae bacterium]
MKYLSRATDILHRVTSRANGDQTVLTISSEGEVELNSRGSRYTGKLHETAFAELVDRLEQYRFKRITGTYGDAMLDYHHDVEVHEGLEKKSRCTLRFNHEYGSFVGQAPEGIREFVTLLTRLSDAMRDGLGDVSDRPALLAQLGPDIEFPYNNPYGRPGAAKLLDTTGAELPASGMQWSRPISGGLIPCRDKSGQYGFIRSSGEFVILPQYQATLGFSEGLAAVQTKAGWGYIDAGGSMLIDPQFNHAQAFRDGMARVEKAGKRGWVNRQSKFIPAPDGARTLGDFSSGFAHFETLNRIGVSNWGYVNQAGDIAIKPEYDEAGPFTEGLAWVRTDDGCGYIDPTGNLKIPGQFDRANPFYESMAVIQNGGYAGYCDPQGKVVIEPQFVSAGRFSDGLAPVRIGAKMGYINTQGKLMSKPRFDIAEPFVDGIANIRVDHRWGYINISGQVVVRPTYIEAHPVQDGVLCVRAFAPQTKLVGTGSSKIIVNLGKKSASKPAT